MAYNSTLTNFAQSIYLVMKNRYFDDISSTDGQNFITQVIDWTNQLLDELEQVTDSRGEPVNWSWMRQANFELGDVTAGDTTLDLDSTVQAIIADQQRKMTLTLGATVLSRWEVVSGGQVNNFDANPQPDRVSVMSKQLVFSRAFTTAEDGATLTGDALVSVPRLSETNQKALSMVKPKQLLILGVAKNSTLPDIVQGGLSPSYIQKYNDLLQGAIARNNVTSVADTVIRDDYSYISGVGF